jgi:hypothetical protein
MRQRAAVRQDAVDADGDDAVVGAEQRRAERPAAVPASTLLLDRSIASATLSSSLV